MTKAEREGLKVLRRTLLTIFGQASAFSLLEPYTKDLAVLQEQAESARETGAMMAAAAQRGLQELNELSGKG